MTKSSLPKNVALFLFGLVLLLLTSNIIITKYVNNDEQPKNREALSGIEIDRSFHSALKNYGFSDTWISKKKIKNISGDSLFATYYVKVPKDVPIHLLILELKRIFWENEVSIEAEEIVSTKRTILKLSSGKKLKLSAEFEYAENVIREYGTVSFLVTDLPLQDEEMLDEFLKTPESFYCVLIPNTESKKHLALLSKSNKRFAMMLNDDITELDYKLSSNYTEDRLSRSIREIVGTFYSAAFFIVDEKSDLYESKKFAFIEKQFKKRGIVLVTKGKMESIKASTFQLENDFHDFMSSLKKDDEKVLMVSAENYLTISTLIPSYRKIGYKFIYPGDIIIKR